MYEGKSHTLFAKYAVPQMIGLLFNSVYMIVDGVFIGNRLGRDASIVSLESAKMPFYRSTRHRKSGQEVFDLLPAFVAIRMAATLFQLIVDAVL